jgi:hypothetical protein
MLAMFLNRGRKNEKRQKNIPNQPFVIQSNNCTFAARLSG